MNKRQAEEEKFRREQEEAAHAKANQKEQLRLKLEEEKQRNMEREAAHLEEMKLLQEEAMQRQQPSTPKAGAFDVCAAKTAPSSPPIISQPVVVDDEEVKKAKRMEEERLMFEQECF